MECISICHCPFLSILNSFPYIPLFSPVFSVLFLSSLVSKETTGKNQLDGWNNLLGCFSRSPRQTLTARDLIHLKSITAHSCLCTGETVYFDTFVALETALDSTWFWMSLYFGSFDKALPFGYTSQMTVDKGQQQEILLTLVPTSTNE